MKAEYIKPSMRVVKISRFTFVCTSNNRLSLPKTSSSDYEDEVDFE